MICVVNRNKDEAITTDIISQQGSFSGSFTIDEVNGPGLKTGNDFGKENIKTISKPSVKVSGSKFTYSFPPHSFTLLKGSLQK